MNDFYENRTLITEDGYAAIYRARHWQEDAAFHIIAFVCAVPFVIRYFIILLHAFHITTITGFRAVDLWFLLPLVITILAIYIPAAERKNWLASMRGSMELSTQNQYLFYPDQIQMMTSTTPQRFIFGYEDLTWVRKSGTWLVLYFEREDLTLLVRRDGFSKGTARGCLQFLHRKQEENRR